MYTKILLAAIMACIFGQAAIVEPNELPVLLGNITIGEQRSTISLPALSPVPLKLLDMDSGFVVRTTNNPAPCYVSNLEEINPLGILDVDLGTSGNICYLSAFSHSNMIYIFVENNNRQIVKAASRESNEPNYYVEISCHPFGSSESSDSLRSSGHMICVVQIKPPNSERCCAAQ